MKNGRIDDLFDGLPLLPWIRLRLANNRVRFDAIYVAVNFEKIEEETSLAIAKDGARGTVARDLIGRFGFVCQAYGKFRIGF